MYEELAGLVDVRDGRFSENILYAIGNQSLGSVLCNRGKYRKHFDIGSGVDRASSLSRHHRIARKLAASVLVPASLPNRVESLVLSTSQENDTILGLDSVVPVKCR